MSQEIFMRRSSNCALIFLCLLADGSGPAGASDYRAHHCSYFNSATDHMSGGDCSLVKTKMNGHFGYDVSFVDGTKVSIEYVAAQSGHHYVWKINGQLGMGYEIDRTHVSGATVDLKQIIEWGDTDPPTIGDDQAPKTISGHCRTQQKRDLPPARWSRQRALPCQQ
jgi:hypothetical protein